MKELYERIATIAEALPEVEREEFATLLDDIRRNGAEPGSNRNLAIRRWLKDAGWL